MDGATLDRYMRGLLDEKLPCPKELFVRIEGAADDALADELATAADELGAPRFMISDGALITWAKTWGNPWDLHDAMTGLRALSARFPTLVFAIDLAPDGPAGQLRAGAFVDLPFADLASWVAGHPRPRFAGVDLRATLTVRSSRTVLAKLRDELAALAPITEIRGGLALAIDRADHVASLTDRAIRAVAFADDAWRLEIELTGALTWRHTVTDFVGALALKCLLATLLRGVPSPPGPIAVDEPIPDLVPAPALARIALPDVLEVEIAERRWVMRSADGAFTPVPASELAPDLGIAPSAYRRRELGKLGGDRILVDTALDLGRIRKRLVVRAPDGTERSSRDFINTTGPELDLAGARAFLIAERDGVPELRVVDLAIFAETCLCSFADVAAPDQLLFHGALYGLVRDRTATRVVRYADGTPEVIAEVAGAFELCTRLGEVILIQACVLEFDHDRNRVLRHDSLLHEVSLATGRVRSVPLGPGRCDSVRRTGVWLAWSGSGLDVVRIFEGLELRRELPIPPGHQLRSLAISSSGAVARVLTDDLSARTVDEVPRTIVLEVARGDELATCAMPMPLTVEWVS